MRDVDFEPDGDATTPGFFVRPAPALISPDEIRGLTLWQPWASLVAMGAKTIETRGYATAWRGILAIHAAKITPPHVRATCYQPGRFREALEEVGLDGDVSALPHGAIVAVTTVQRVDPAGSIKFDLSVSRRELRFGNYAPGRYAWRLGTVAAVDPPIRYRGKQSLFFLDRDTIDEIRRRSRRLPEVA